MVRRGIAGLHCTAHAFALQQGIQGMTCFGMGCESWGPSVWAVWAQAFFSVLALCIAIMLPWGQRRRERKAEHVVDTLKARSLALLAGRACEQVMADVSEVLELRVTGTSNIYFGESARCAARVPDELRAMIPDLPLLGGNGALLQDMILVLQGIEAMQRGYDRQVAGHINEFGDAFPFIGEQFELAMRIAEELELRLGNLFDVRPLGMLDFKQAIAASQEGAGRGAQNIGSVS